MAHQLCYVALKNPSHFASAHCVCVQCKVCYMYIVRHLVGIVPLNLGAIHHQFNRHHCKWDHPQKSYLQTNIYIAQNCHLSLECLQQHWKIMNLPLSSAIIIVLIVLYISAPYLALQEVQVYLFLLVYRICNMKILVSVTF